MKPLIPQTNGFFVPTSMNYQAHEAFWGWFIENQAHLTGPQASSQAVIRVLEQRIKELNPYLTCEIGINQASEQQLVISADGFRAAFPHVLALYKCAPVIDGWTIVAFRPRVGSLEELHCDGFDTQGVAANQLWYRTQLMDDSLALYLFIEGLTEDNSDALSEATYFLLDMALGEYDVETKLGLVELRPLTSDPQTQGLRQFSQLCREVDAFFFQH